MPRGKNRREIIFLLLNRRAINLTAGVILKEGKNPLGARNRYHLSFWFFFHEFYSTFWPNFGAVHVARPVVVL